GQEDGSVALRALGFGAPPAAPFISNFLIGHIDLGRFRSAHEFVADAFRAMTGATLDAFLTCLWALSNIALLPARILFRDRQPADTLHEPLRKNLVNIVQRGYTLFRAETGEIVDEIAFRAKHFGCGLPWCNEVEIGAAVENMSFS